MCSQFPILLTRRIEIQPAIADTTSQTRQRHQQENHKYTHASHRCTTILPLLLCLLLCFSSLLGPLSSSSHPSSCFVRAEHVQINTASSSGVTEPSKDATYPIPSSPDTTPPSPTVAIPTPTIEELKSATAAADSATPSLTSVAADTSISVTTQTTTAPTVDSKTSDSVKSTPAAPSSEAVVADQTPPKAEASNDTTSKDNATPAAATPASLTDATTAVVNASAPPSNESAIADVSSTVIPIPPPLTTLTAPPPAAVVAVQPAAPVAVPQQATATAIPVGGNTNAVIATTAAVAATAATPSAVVVVDPSNSSTAVATPVTAVAAVPAAPPAVVLVPVVAILPTIAPEVKKEEIPRLDAYKQTVLEIVAEKKGKKKQKEEEDKKKKEVEDASIAAAAAAAAAAGTSAVPIASSLPTQASAPSVVPTSSQQQPAPAGTETVAATPVAPVAVPAAGEAVAASPAVVAPPTPSAGALAAAASIAAAVNAAAANLAAKTAMGTDAPTGTGAASTAPVPVVAGSPTTAPVVATPASSSTPPPAVAPAPPAPAPLHPAAIPRPPEEGAAASQRRDRFNYAAFDAGAKLLATSEGMKKGNSILIADDDRYMMVPCGNTHKYFVIQLSEDIIIDTIELANLEHYASSIKDFQILGSATHPTSSWLLLGSYTALDSTQKQVFTLPSKEWVRFIKLRWVSHYGDEYYCTLTYLRVYGTTMLETFREEMQKSEDEVKEFSLELSDIKPLGSSNTVKEEVPVAAVPTPVAVPIPAVVPIPTPTLTIAPSTIPTATAVAVDPNVVITVVPVIPVVDIAQSNQTLQPEVVIPVDAIPSVAKTETAVEIPSTRQPSSPTSASPMPWVGQVSPQSPVRVEVQPIPTQTTFAANTTAINSTGEVASSSQVSNHTTAAGVNATAATTVTTSAESQPVPSPAAINSNVTSPTAVSTANATAIEVTSIPGSVNVTDEHNASKQPGNANATSAETTSSSSPVAPVNEIPPATPAPTPSSTAASNVIITPPPPSAQTSATATAATTTAATAPVTSTIVPTTTTPPAATVPPTPVPVVPAAVPAAAPVATPIVPVPVVATPIVVPIPVASALSSISADPQLLADAQVIAERISNPTIDPPVQTKEAPPKPSGSTGSSSGSSGGGQQSIFKALTNRIKELEIHQALANNYVSDLADRYVNDMNGVKLKMEGMVLEMAAHMARNEKQWQEGWSMMNQTAQYVQADNQRVLQQMREQLEEAQTLVDLVEGIIQVQLGLTFILIIGYFLGRSLLSIARSLMKLVWVCLCKRSTPPQHNTHRKNRQSMSARSKSASNLFELIGDDPVLQQQILMMNNSTSFDPNDPVIHHSRKQSRANRRSFDHAGLPSPPMFHASSSEPGIGANATAAAAAGHDAHQRAMSVVMPNRSILRQQQQNGGAGKNYRSMSLSNSVNSSPQFGGVNSMRRVNSYANGTGSGGSLSPSVSFEQIAEQSHGEHDEFSLDALSMEQSKVTDSDLQAMKEYENDNDVRVRGVEPRRKNSGSQNLPPPVTPSASQQQQTPVAHKKRSSLGAGLMRLLSGSSSNLAAMTNTSTTPPVVSGSPIAPDAPLNGSPVPGRTPTLPVTSPAGHPMASQSDSALDLQPTVDVSSNSNAATAASGNPLSPSLRDRRSTQPAPLLRGLISGVTATGALVAGGARLIASGIARARSNTASASNSPLKSKHPSSVASGSHSPASDHASVSSSGSGGGVGASLLEPTTESLSADAKVSSKPRADSQPSIRIPHELLSASSSTAIANSTSSSSSSSSSPVIHRPAHHNSHGLSPLKLSEELGSGEHKSDSTSPSSSSMSFATSIDGGGLPHTAQFSILPSPTSDLSPIAASPLPTPHGEAESNSNGRFAAQFETAHLDAREDGAPSRVATSHASASAKKPQNSKHNSGRKAKSHN